MLLRFAAIAIVILAFATAAVLLVMNRPPAGQKKAKPNPDTEVADPNKPFQELGREAGLDFKMAYLADREQRTFKTNLYDHGCGLAVADYDGDGHEDVYLLNQVGGNGLFRNQGDGTFVEDKEARRVVGLSDRISVGATFSDYDNDGDQDLYVTSTRSGNVLFQNDGKGKFTDVTKKAGLEHIGHSQSAAFFDYDGDGDLDLLLTNSAKWTYDVMFESPTKYYPGMSNLFQMSTSPKEYNVLYRNNGDGTFTDATESSGLKGDGWCGDIAVFDYDQDGDFDVILTNMFAISRLFQNDGKGKFKDVTLQTLKRTSFGGIAVRAFDYNNDGQLDVFITDMHSDMWMPPDFDSTKIKDRKKHKGLTGPMMLTKPQHENDFAMAFKINYKEAIFGNTFFRNEGKGVFKEVSDEVNLETFWPWGIATGDFDNNGFVDVFIPSGMGFVYFYWRNYLMMNDGKGKFIERSGAGIEPPPGGKLTKDEFEGKPFPRSSRCAVTGDFDNDGRVDIVVNNYNDRPFYFRNRYPKKNYLALKLEGTKSNRDAIGAMVTLHANGQKMVRQVHAASGYLSHSSKTLHFGLADIAEIEKLEIRWPSGLVQTVTKPKVNSKLHIKEGSVPK